MPAGLLSGLLAAPAVVLPKAQPHAIAPSGGPPPRLISSDDQQLYIVEASVVLRVVIAVVVASGLVCGGGCLEPSTYRKVYDL